MQVMPSLELMATDSPFEEPETWGEPQAAIELQDEQWGQVCLRRWDSLHARQDMSTAFSLLLVEAH